MNMLTIRAGACEYRVYIGRGLIASLGERVADLFPQSRFAMITDTNVEALYGEKIMQDFEDCGAECALFSIEPGEASKSAETYAQLLSALAQNEFNRADVIIALGGGVVGDLAGFVAATYLRGIPYVQVPTTLLAQIDSAVGGKTAINLPEGKNLAGAFYHPSAVYADTDVLDTLDASDFADGMAELIKYALIKDAAMFAALEENEAVSTKSENLDSLIMTCLGIKRNVVAADERDRGDRMLLNFGHTIGHGIERLCTADGLPMTHGRAVAIGMAAITAASERAGLTQPGTASRIVALLKKAGLPYDISGYDKDRLLEGIFIDKKNVADTLHLVLVSEPGKSFLYRIDRSDMRNFI
jgi:3-dehydroquinate synthase